MDSDGYIKIIKNGLKKSVRELGLSRKQWIFQQDNGFIYTFSQSHSHTKTNTGIAADFWIFI